MSLSATRSRRSNAGNRWAEALAAVQLESGDAPDLDAEAPGEEFIGKEEEDVFESDFESTDEEEYAKQGVEDGEKQVQMEEKAERRAARAKATKSGAAPTQKILERAMRGQPPPKKKRTSTKGTVEKKPSLLWDATRQSERAATVKHKFQVQERLKDAEKRKAHTTRRPRPVTVPKTQDELIAEALELEEKNTKALREFLQKEEEKRAAARKVVRLKIEGPVIRWVSRGEMPPVEEVERGSSGMSVVPAQTQVQAPATQAPVIQAPPVQVPIVPNPPVQPPAVQAPVAQTPVVKASVAQALESKPLVSQPPAARAPVSQEAPLPVKVSPTPPVPEQSSTSIPTPTPTPTPASAPARASTPLRTPRMQVYVEIPTPSKSMRRSLSSPSTKVSQGLESSPSISRKLNVPSSQPLVRSPLSSTVSLPRSPLSTFKPLMPEDDSSRPLAQIPKPEFSQPTSSRSSAPASSQHLETKPSQPDILRASHRPTAIRQLSVSSSGSTKSKGKMVMYVEIPVRKKGKGGTPAPASTGTVEPSPSGLLLEPSTAPPISVSSTAPPSALSTLDIVTPIVPILSTPPAPAPPPEPTPSTSSKPAHPSPLQKQTRNYVIVEYGGGARASFGWNMQAVFGNHADWEDMLINGVKPTHPVKPICLITGLHAPYRDSRTGIPYANAYAYKTLTRLLAHEFVWSKERGCYVGDEGRNPARSAPARWASAASGRY